MGSTCQDGFSHDLMNPEKSSQVPQQERNRREQTRDFKGMRLAQATNERRVGRGATGLLNRRGVVSQEGGWEQKRTEGRAPDISTGKR